jgi:SsrA-binding protein
MCGWPDASKGPVSYAGTMAKGKKKKVAPGDVASNRYASFKYDLSDKVECGIVLFGTEVKSLRNGGATLKEGYALIRDGEVYLVSVHIPPYGPASRNNHDPDRDRKLLLNRRQIDKLKQQTKEKGLTLVPTRMYFSNGRAKVEIALAKGKNQYDKREAIKGREMKRELSRAMSDARR